MAGRITNLGKRNRIDHMTGLYNKYEFEGDIKKYLVDHMEVDTIGIMILDLDSFKNISYCSIRCRICHPRNKLGYGRHYME